MVIWWLRRDLRLTDNSALYHALKSGYPVFPLFIFDKNILDDLESDDARVEFIHQQLEAIQKQLVRLGSTLDVRFGTPYKVFCNISEEYQIKAVYTNHDYEPYATKRDDEVRKLLGEYGIDFHSFKDQVIFEKDEVIKDNGTPYEVFTPYAKKWKSLLGDKDISPYNKKDLSLLIQRPIRDIPSLGTLGFRSSRRSFPSHSIDYDLIKTYERTRDFPGENGTSRLGVHLRFGTISIRELVRIVKDLNDKFLDELIWREFYQMILWHHPRIVNESFKQQYDKIQWRNNEKEFQRWCDGNTGYPIVDAGMRELNETGYMHNRVRMITASFLTKHLLIDWRWGEAYFAKKLLDYELASNNGGWQWAAGSGCDAAPYFRVFNPAIQTKKFDPELKYVKKWVPEFEEFSYPKPMVEHEFARKRAIETYRKALSPTN